MGKNNPAAGFSVRFSVLAAFTMVFTLRLVAGVDIFPSPLSQRLTRYDMEARLDTDKKVIDGRMILHWKNPSDDTVDELQFHLYLNAFKNTRSTFMKESRGSHRGFGLDGDRALDWGFVDVKRLRVVNGSDLTARMRFIQPDDGNSDDQTVMAVTLDEPVLPQGEIDLEIEFVSKLPKIFARTGYSDDYFLVGQWFPKLGVYEPAGQRYAAKGQWNCHQFHADSEFYANHGVYDVRITLPGRFVVGSGGITQSEKDNGDGTKTVAIRAEDIVDFAWTASPRFRIAQDQWRHVHIQVYLQPEHYSQAGRHIDSVKAALAYFSEHLGAYPYPHLTVVDPPFRGLGSAGMEYTTLITAGCLWGMPPGLRFTEMVSVHEFGHAFFMGILASNEFEEPWLDEGFNTYYEARIMDHAYGARTSLVDFCTVRIGDGDNVRQGYVAMKNPSIAENFRFSWHYPHGGYSPLSYQKTAVWLRTLEGLIGTATMDEIMKTYYQRWKFRHPCARDFIAVVNEVVAARHGQRFGPDMNWFFDQVLYGSDVCDYRLAAIHNRELTPDRGLVGIGGGKELLKKADGDQDGQALFDSEIIVHRLGGVCLPVDVLVCFDDGTQVLETWDGQARSGEFKYRRPQKIVWASLDPQNRIPLDLNRLNNSLRVEPLKKTSWKLGRDFLFFLQNVMQSLSIFS